MLLDDFICNVKILTVLRLSWNTSDADAAPRNFHALSFRVTGNAGYQIGENTLSVKDGDILFVPENLSYHIKAEKEELYVIHFELPEKVQTYLEVFHAEDYKKAHKLFAACYEIWSKKEPGYYFKTLSVFYNILGFMTVCALSKQADTAVYRKLEPAMAYLHAHFTDPDLSVLTLCSVAHLSDTWFRRLFFQYHGVKPVAYINRLRINYAKELLESEYYKVEQVALMAGFEDAKYFSTVFKKYTGRTPSGYVRIFQQTS